MNPKPAVEALALSGIDLKFRPATYFWPLALERHLLSRIKGAHRRAALRTLIATGCVDGYPDFLAQSSLGDEERQILGQMHPAYMGGEYLPEMKDTEVEIARITIASVTQDVTSVFARRAKHRIHYRVVDEYGGDTLCGKARRTSTQPLTLGELEAFFNGAWSIFAVLTMNFSEQGCDREQMQRFVVGVESQFYPQIGKLYRLRIDAWAAALRPEHALMRNE